MLYRNKKTGKLYRYLATAADCTNERRDGTLVSVYCPDDNGHKVYVREYSEFQRRFELCGDEKLERNQELRDN